MPGSDQLINYQLRPSKSIERKMMCELVKQIQIIEGTNELRYIGMGAKYFTDFLLFHNEFGVSDMISIEAERERAIRYEFNKPLKSIQMIYGTTNEVLPQLNDFEKKMNLVWLDYDGAFSAEMLEDIETLCRRLYTGSMFFISCNYSFAGQKVSEKREAFQKSTGDYFDKDIDKSRYTNKGIPVIIQEIVNKVILKTLNKRNRYDEKINMQYKQLLFLTYKDGAPMLTIGGILVDDVLKEKIDNTNVLEKLVYCSFGDKYFSIEIPKLTYKEIQVVLKNIPITDEEYFEDDIVGLFCAWLKKVYGEDTLEENLDFIANALGNKGKTSREIIRNYFLTDFIKDHIKTYQKRPIYWLFDSGKQNGFKALVYMHRWNADTIGNVRVEYLHRIQRVYEKEITRMQEIIDNSHDNKEISNATKRKEKLQKQIKETKDYDAKIAHLALSRIDIDLDGGVKVNYEKVQTADGKKMQILAKI